MISLIEPVAAGNALRVFLEPPAGARSWRLLRKLSDSFTGEDDPDAIIAYEGADKPVLDIKGLVNSTLYYYRPYYHDGVAWSAGETVSSTPAASYYDLTTDVLSLVRERLDLGLQEELARGTLVHDDGHVKVLTAPPLDEDTRWPVVTVHLQDEAPSEHGIGEMIAADEFDEAGFVWGQSEGYLARTQLSIMGWSLNPDERVDLRKALRRIVVANLPVFDFAGMVEIEFSYQDMEDCESYNAPVYQALCTLRCLAPVRVGSNAGAIREVISNANVE